MTGSTKLIAFSGLDGCGKSTQIEQLKQHYFEKGYRPAVRWSRIGYTPLFSTLKLVLRRLFRKLPAAGHSENRSEMLKKHSVSLAWIRLGLLDLILYYGIYFRWLKMRQRIVIADRYIWDAYLDLKINFPNYDLEKSILWTILVRLAVKPNWSIFLEIPLDVTLERRRNKFEPFPDSDSVLAQRKQLYDQILPDKHYYSVNANQSISDVTQAILTIIHAN